MARALEELEGAQALPPTQAERDKAMETYIKEGDHPSFGAKFNAMPNAAVTQ